MIQQKILQARTHLNIMVVSDCFSNVLKDFTSSFQQFVVQMKYSALFPFWVEIRTDSSIEACD